MTLTPPHTADAAASPRRAWSRPAQAGSGRLAVVALLTVAAAVRLWGVHHDLPFSFYGDELHMMKRAMAMGTGDLNPHWFHKPAFLMYVLLATYGGMFGVGRLAGWFESPEEFGAYFLHDHGAFLLAGRLVVVAFGVMAVGFTYRLARDVMQSRAAGLAAGSIAAVVPGLVDSGQQIKSDVPCAALMMAALSVYWRARTTGSVRGTVLAGLLSGGAMGMHFYAIVLLPTYAVLELMLVWRRAATFRDAFRRLAILGAMFGLAFFVTAPYTFLDPEGMAYLNPGPEGINFIPGTAPIPYDTWWYTPAVHILFVLGNAGSFGPWLTALAVIGFVAWLAARKTRDAAVLLLVPVVSFTTIAAVVTAYHAETRHLCPLYALLSIAAVGGALSIARHVAASRGPVISCTIVVLCLVPAVARTADLNRHKIRDDSRVVAYRWIMANLPRDGRMLLDDYGPQVPQNLAAVRRQQAKLAALPKSPFTVHQDQRLALLTRYPAEHGFDLEELGHQWWLGRELTEEALRSSLFHLDMSNPLVSRVPRPLDDYRESGYRWVVTNSFARSRYRPGYPDREHFPSFAAFYDELPRRARLIRQFDPAEWGGKGPVIWIYDLQPREAPPGSKGGF